MRGYMPHGLTLSMGQKENLAKAVGDGTSVTLPLANEALDGPDMLMLTKTQINRIMKKKAEGAGMDLVLSGSQLMAMKRAKMGGGPFLGALLAGVAAPLVGKVLGFGMRGAGAEDTQQGEGLYLPGTRAGEEAAKMARDCSCPEAADERGY